MGNHNCLTSTTSDDNTTAQRHSPSNTGRVLGGPIEDVHASYNFDRELGRGQFFVTYLVTHKTSNLQFCCKSIETRKLFNQGHIDNLRREVEIMRHLTGHANIVKLQDAIEDQHYVNLIMEWCAGGQLFDRIIAKKPYPEHEAAKLFRQIVTAVQYCHSKGVMHRDIKPENFLLLSSDDDSLVKVTEFGHSVFLEPGAEVFTDLVGSAYYIAPEVLRRNYSAKADVWSAGVILYSLLSGVPPFWADHPWMRDREPPNEPIDIAVLTSMKHFREMNKLKKVALRVIAENLSEEEIRGLKEMSKYLDTDNNRTIAVEELTAGLLKLDAKLSESEVKQLVEAADVDGDGTINEMEFITATMHMNMMEKEDRLYKAFEYFDKDKSGYITMEGLKQALKKYNMRDEETILEIIAEVDKNNDGKITYDEFVTMMKNGNPDLVTNRQRR